MHKTTKRATVRRALDGFTLIELVVAIAIFGVMAAAGYGGLRNVLHARASIDARQTEFGHLVTAVNLLQQDVENAVARSVRDEFGDNVPAMRGGVDGALLELTRYTAAGSFRDPGVDLRRVEYRLEENLLLRLSWNELDRYQGSVPQRRLFLNEIVAAEFRFFGTDWTEYWPLRPGAASLTSLPNGVEVTLRYRDGKTLRRTFLVES